MSLHKLHKLCPHMNKSPRPYRQLEGQVYPNIFILVTQPPYPLFKDFRPVCFAPPHYLAGSIPDVLRLSPQFAFFKIALCALLSDFIIAVSSKALVSGNLLPSSCNNYNYKSCRHVLISPLILPHSLSVRKPLTPVLRLLVSCR